MGVQVLDWYRHNFTGCPTTTWPKFKIEEQTSCWVWRISLQLGLYFFVKTLIYFF